MEEFEFTVHMVIKATDRIEADEMLQEALETELLSDQSPLVSFTIAPGTKS